MMPHYHDLISSAMNKTNHTAFLLSLAGLCMSGLSACSDKQEFPSERQELEHALEEASEASGFLWLDREITMLDLETAMEQCRSLPITPQQAMEAVRTYVQEHPEAGIQRMCSLDSLIPKHARISLFGHYYFFRSLRNNKFDHPRLVGFFVDTRSGQVIPYPGEGFSGEEEDSPYQVTIPYHEDSAGKILIAPDSADAQYSLGWAYLNGRGVPQSPQQGAEWLRRAADQGDRLAQRDYADCCLQGRGTPASPQEAIRYYRMAASQQYPDDVSARMLGHCYARGEGVAPSWEQAAHWYSMAAPEDTEGRYCLAECYEKGLGVPLSREKAIEHYRIIANDRRAAYDEEQRLWANKAAAAIHRLSTQP